MLHPTSTQQSTPATPKLFDQVRSFMRARRYSLRTERSYCAWIERFIRFHYLWHPSEMGT